MLNRKKTTAKTTSATTVTPEPAAPVVETPTPKCLRPSNFATRAEATADRPAPAPVLVSMGMTERAFRNPNEDRFEVFEVELFYEKADPMKRYFKVAGDTITQPMFDDGQNTEKVTRYENAPLRRPDSSAFPPAAVVRQSVSLGFFPGGIGRPESSAFA